MQTIQAPTLTTYIQSLFQAAGAPVAHAERVANSLVSANLAGHDSHGVIRTVQYLNNIRDGMLDPTATPAIVRETGVVTMVDGQRSFGQVAAHYAINIAIEKAKTYGTATTGLFNSAHVGRLGEWVALAADEKMIGVGYCNGGSRGGLVAPHGGRARRLGTNPLACAIPRANAAPIVVDFATSVVAEGKVRVARNGGKALAPDRILDVNGEPSTNPADLYAGGMLLPAAEHKGYCLGLMMDFLGGILTGGGCAVLPTFQYGNAVLFTVHNIEAFRPLDEFLADGELVADAMITTPPRPGVERVLLPGEPEQLTAKERLQQGIPIDDNTWQQLVEAGTALQVGAPAIG
jgi:uncharacterized oxidoreductase